MRAAVRSCGVGSRLTMDRAGLTTVVAQCRPHPAHLHAWTWGEVVPVIRCTLWVAPHPGQSASVGSVTVDWSSLGHRAFPAASASRCAVSWSRSRRATSSGRRP